MRRLLPFFLLLLLLLPSPALAEGENLLVNAGMSIASDGDVMGRAGISIAVGKGSGKKPALARDMTEMQRQLADVQTALLQLREENKELREKLERK